MLYESIALPTELARLKAVRLRLTTIFRPLDFGFVTPSCHRSVLSMKTEALEETQVARKVVFHRVAENLYRLETSGGYYALLKRGDKQFRRSLRTKDRKLAERRLSELRAKVGNLTISDDARLSFADVAKRWMAVTSHTLKASSALRREASIKQIAPF